MQVKISFKSAVFLTAALLWLLLTMFAMSRLWDSERVAGVSGHPPAHWRRSTPVALDPDKATLIMLLHPRCPCSRASLTELNRLTALCPDRANISVFFLKPTGCRQAWTDTDLWRQASSIPGVSVHVDAGGKIARCFGAVTSGETVLYTPNGRLLYQGGLTGERGHEGDNSGLAAVAALLRGTAKRAEQEPVYGCPLTVDRTTPDSPKALWRGLPWLP